MLLGWMPLALLAAAAADGLIELLSLVVAVIFVEPILGRWDSIAESHWSCWS